ncbi:hypothetical protein TEA_002854 [Camellia sinensis var. sinensis]|uniref:S-adenosylmethionine-dependent methyltransferase n=1 Tax=Camellia sinensis var. sinensis TaxID=542762 RepID=A0A4S4D5Z5_CAMSN|nr:hypothetical protein TEA_002854 [Camellia sinensis var. sinensis]
MIKDAIVDKFDITSLSFSSNTIRIADLGCSVGPNTFIAMQNVLEAMEMKFHSQNATSEMPEFQLFFSDHTSNDFNRLFSSLPPDRQYFATGVPGSFHGRLFPKSSLHFVHSSIAVHWLSKVPEELLDKSCPAWNKGRIHCTSAPKEVINAYTTQFAKDMETFFNARADEIEVGGMMIVTLPAHYHPLHLPPPLPPTPPTTSTTTHSTYHLHYHPLHLPPPLPPTPPTTSTTTHSTYHLHYHPLHLPPPLPPTPPTTSTTTHSTYHLHYHPLHLPPPLPPTPPTTSTTTHSTYHLHYHPLHLPPPLPPTPPTTSTTTHSTYHLHYHPLHLPPPLPPTPPTTSTTTHSTYHLHYHPLHLPPPLPPSPTPKSSPI